MSARAIVLLFALMALRPAPAEACTCEGPRPPCQALFYATVFVGKVTSVVGDGGRAKTTFQVLDTLNSAFRLPKTITIEHGTDGTSCGIAFSKGATYVVYAGGTSPADLDVSSCGNTHGLRKNDPDVALAKKRPTRKTALVEGKLQLYEDGQNKPLSGLTVRVGSKRATTDADGGFRLDLPVGKHPVQIDSTELRAYQGQTYSISIPSVSACPKPIFTYLYDGRIEGTVTGADGKPVAGVTVGAIGAAADTGKNGGTAQTDAQGHFLLHGVPAGTYRVGVSLGEYGGPSVDSPYPTTFHPKTIVLPRAGLVSGIDVRLPAPIKRVTFKGTVRRADGTPLPKAYVVIDTERLASGVDADEAGAYTAVVLAGGDVTLKACDGDTCVTVNRTKVAADETIDLTVR